MLKEDIELVLLPPKEKVEVKKEDIVQAYAQMIVLLSETTQNRQLAWFYDIIELWKQR